MSITRPFAYNTGNTISGTEQIGDLAIGIDDIEYSTNPGGVQWWMGPDEDLGYVITFPVSGGTQPNPLGIPAFISFKRSEDKTEGSFVSFVNYLFGQTFTTGSECKIYLNTNGYWTSYEETTTTTTTINNNLLVYLDSGDLSSYSGTGSTWTDLTNNNNDSTLINSPTFSSSNQGIIEFNDSSSQYGTIPDLGDLPQWTVEVWFRLSSPLTGKVTSLVTNEFDLVDRLNFSIGTNRAPVNSNLCVGFYDGTWRNTTGFIPQVGEWYQVVGTYDGSVIRQYVNGASSGGTLNYVGTPESGGEVRLMRRWDQSLITSNLVDGDLTIVKIYNTAISSGDVLDNFDENKNRYGL